MTPTLYSRTHRCRLDVKQFLTIKGEHVIHITRQSGSREKSRIIDLDAESRGKALP